ncbi:hypothetical protein ACQPZA_06925 [Pseudonocardia xinjiangensis]|uniref:hypothetical protein n=1 Tax=Pseudonocardia xinjiangensis TaxID=75289 RepID=UPI003D8DF161
MSDVVRARTLLSFASPSNGRLIFMCSHSLDVLLFVFHDARRAAAVLERAAGLPEMRHVAVVARSADGEIRVEARQKTGERQTVLRQVIDALGSPLRRLSPFGTDGATAGPPLTLPDTGPGLAAFARLIQPGHPVLLVASCTGLTSTMDEIAEHLGAAVYRVPLHMVGAEPLTRIPSTPWTA